MFSVLKMGKNANFCTDGPILVIFPPLYQQDLTKTLLRQKFYCLAIASSFVSLYFGQSL